LGAYYISSSKIGQNDSLKAPEAIPYKTAIMIREVAVLAYGQAIVRAAATRDIGIMLFRGPIELEISPHVTRP
jgi:hypothetical protein